MESFGDATDNGMHSRKTALVAGGAGFIGSHLCQSLLDRGFFVYAVDNFITGRRLNIKPFLSHERFSFDEIDITSSEFGTAFADRHLDIIFHLACPTGVPNIERLSEEMLLTSSFGTHNICELARRHDARLVYTSTAEVYGHPEVSPQSESYNGNVNPIGPRAPYEEGKRFGETLIAVYAKKYGVNGTVVRIFNTFGPGMSLEDKRVIPRILRSVKTGDSITIYGDGTQTRTHLYVDDLIEGLFLVMDKGKPGEAYNIGGVDQVQIKELAKIIMRLTKRKNNVSYEPHFIEDHKSRKPCVEKMRKLGWSQNIPLEEGLLRMMTIHGLRT